MATQAETPKAENLAAEHPGKTQEPASEATYNTGSSPNGGSEPKGIVSAVASEASNDAPLTDVQKKMRRAERFGISVQLCRQEKRNSRVERFGPGSTLQASSTSRSNDLKGRAREERFGITHSSTADDDKPRKKARLPSFAPVSTIDPMEEEKRKARAIRFSNPPPCSLSQANGKEDIEPIRRPLLQAELPDGPERLLASLLVGNFIV
ncbi:protein MODIFIER OF SNC1 11 [Neltuma alba]|uniref:protein MODIFIER OF SNC1 11 n=1 Tax=Neltuma alba TaxID=207710 RepID=UPI0010A3B5B6|nr:protein MODIFIER OF SNC1 11 [Prosopis alba]